MTRRGGGAAAGGGGSAEVQKFLATVTRRSSCALGDSSAQSLLRAGPFTVCFHAVSSNPLSRGSTVFLFFF